MQLVSDVEIWNIVAHIAFKFSWVASGTFSTGSTHRLSDEARERLEQQADDPTQAES